MAILIISLLVASFVIPLILIARCILVPVDRAAKSRQSPVRFSIADVFCLFIIIQVPFSGVQLWMQDAPSGAIAMMVTIAALVSVLIWYFGARTLSRAGVSRGTHRFVYLGLILPFVYYACVPYCGLPFFILGSTVDALPPSLATLLILLWIGGTVVFVAIAIFTGRMLASARPATEWSVLQPEDTGGDAIRLPPAPETK